MRLGIVMLQYDASVIPDVRNHMLGKYSVNIQLAIQASIDIFSIKIPVERMDINWLSELKRQNGVFVNCFFSMLF